MSAACLTTADRWSVRPLRVLHVVFSLDIGGLENGVVNLCNRLDQERFAPSICTFLAGGTLEAYVDASRVETFNVQRRWNNDPTLPFRMAWQLNRRRIDILHTHSWGTLVEGVLGARMARVPTIIHGEHGLLRSQRRNLIVQRWLWRKAHQLLAVSEPLADRMARVVGFPRSQIKVIGNGVDTQRFRANLGGQVQSRTRWGLPVDKLLLGMAARLDPVKNHLGVFRAVDQVRRQGLDVAIALAGDGPLRDELEKAARDLGIDDRVHFLGNVKQIDVFYSALDVFVLNSHSEGMSNTVLEAMASGLPVVATAVGSNPELVVEGRTGLLVPPGDVASLADGLARLARLPGLRQAMGAAGRRRAESQYSIDRMVRQYETLYERLAVRGRSSTGPRTANFSPSSSCVVA